MGARNIRRKSARFIHTVRRTITQKQTTDDKVSAGSICGNRGCRLHLGGGTMKRTEFLKRTEQQLITRRDALRRIAGG